MSNQVEINLTEPQFDFYKLKSKFGLFRGGVGSGKTFIGSVWAKDKIANEPHAKGFIGANTYNQLRNATLTRFFQVLEDHNIPYDYNQQRNIIDVAGRTVYAYSLDNYENIRGIEFGWGWVDEAAFAKEAAFRVLLGRLRDNNAKHLEMRLTTTGFGFNWLYDYFEGDKKTKEFDTVTASTFDNPYLPDGYAESLKDIYDEKIYRQEVLGEYVAINVGSVYYAFNRKNNVKPVAFNPKFPIYVGMDFNVNPMAAMAFQVYDNKVWVFKEFWTMSSNSDEMAQRLVEEIGRVIIIPDATGKAVKTSSRGLSDHQILRNYGHTVIFNNNPGRMDRYNCVNGLLEKDRLTIDPSCKYLIKDLERVAFKEGSTEPDTTNDKSLTHMSDGLGYGCWFHFPIVRNPSGVFMVER